MKSLLLKFSWWFFYVALSAWVQAEELGQRDFENNCQACHDVKNASVGPSLIEIRKLYPKEKKQQFLIWSKNPGKKRAGGLRMPAMSHLDDGTLGDIHHYILNISEGVSDEQRRHNFSFTAPPKTYPYYQRGYMPFASPASIGMVFNKKLGVNWDAAICRLRYVFYSEKSFFNAEKNQQALAKDIVYQETAEHLWSFAEGKKAVFKGYRLIDELPEFIYRIGDITVHEKFVAIPGKNSFMRHFSLQGVTQSIVLDLSHKGDIKISAFAGRLAGHKLTLNPQEAKQFSLAMSLERMSIER